MLKYFISPFTDSSKMISSNKQDMVLAGSYFLHCSLPQMYMQALLGPAVAGSQTPLTQLTSETKSENIDWCYFR